MEGESYHEEGRRLEEEAEAEEAEAEEAEFKLEFKFEGCEWHRQCSSMLHSF